MATKSTGNKKHLTLADRAAIEHGISCGENFHRSPAGSTRILLRYRKRFGGIFFASLIFKMRCSANAPNVNFTKTVTDSSSVATTPAIPFAGNAVRSAAPCIVRTLHQSSVTGSKSLLMCVITAPGSAAVPMISISTELTMLTTRTAR